MAYEQKTVPTDADVDAFIASVADPARRDEAVRLVPLMRRASGEPPVLWGGSLVGFGRYDFRRPTGHTGHAFLTGFSPRKAALTVYVTTGFDGFASELERLGRYRTSVSCLYLKRLADVDEAVLEEIVRLSVERMRAAYPPTAQTR